MCTPLQLVLWVSECFLNYVLYRSHSLCSLTREAGVIAKMQLQVSSFHRMLLRGGPEPSPLIRWPLYIPVSVHAFPASNTISAHACTTF